VSEERARDEMVAHLKLSGRVSRDTFKANILPERGSESSQGEGEGEGKEGGEAPVALYRLKDLIVDFSSGCLGRCGEDSDRLLESSSQIQVVPLEQILR
jgi:hypothetical protein